MSRIAATPKQLVATMEGMARDRHGPGHGQVPLGERVSVDRAVRSPVDRNRAPVEPNFRFIYFNIKARGELVRLIFHAVGVKFEDIRLNNDATWLEMKADTPFKTLPVLDFEGRQLGQTMSIARFLASEFGIRGHTIYEQAVADSVAETADDLLSDYLEVILHDKHSKKLDFARRNFVENILPTTLDRLDNFQKLYSREYGYIVGTGLTYADLAVYNVIDQVLRAGLVEVGYYQQFRYPTELRKRILTHGGITRYLNDRPQTDI